jgi:hypothetical protein
MSYIGQGLPADTFQGFTTDTFTGDGSATTFTLSKAPFSADSLIVVVDNVIQQPTTNFTVSGTTLTIVGTAILSGIKGYAIHTGGPLPIGGASELDLNGASDKLILDADGDTTISADTDDQIDFKTGGSDRMHIESGGNVGIGTSSTQAMLHVLKNDSGALNDSNSDNFMIEDTSATGMTIGSSTSGEGHIYFSDSDDADVGTVSYFHGSNYMRFRSNASEALRFTGQQVSTGAEDAPDVSAGGLTLDLNAEDGNVLTCKSSDVAHGVTNYAEADTFFQIRKLVAASGGAILRGWTEGEQAIQIFGAAESANTTKSTTGEGICAVTAYVRSGADPVDPGTNANLFVVNQGGNAKFIVDTEGQLHSDGGAQSAYDTYEDAQLVRAFDLSHGRGVIDSKFDKFISYNHEKLADMKLVGREEDGTPNHFINVTGMQRLHNGAIWQQYEKHQRLAEAVYEMAKEALGEDKADAILKKHDIKLLN